MIIIIQQDVQFAVDYLMNLKKTQEVAGPSLTLFRPGEGLMYPQRQNAFKTQKIEKKSEKQLQKISLPIYKLQIVI